MSWVQLPYYPLYTQKFRTKKYGDFFHMTETKIIVNTPNITTKSENDELVITGIASTTNKDLQNEIVSKEAIISMQKQVVGLNLHLDHNHSYDGAIGVITESLITQDNELIITAKIFPTYAKDIREKLEFGMSMGLSIGGIPKRNKDKPNVIDDIKLLEVSLTPLPANNDSHGSVSIVKGVIISDCFGKACHKLIEMKNMVEKEQEVEETAEDIDAKAVTQQEEKEPTEETEEVSEEEIEKEFGENECIQLFNELMAEKEEVIVEELSKKMEAQITNIVEEILNKKDDSEEEVTEEEVEEKAEEKPNEEESAEEPTEPVTEEEDEVDKAQEEDDVEKAYPNLENKPQTKIENIKNLNLKTFLNSETRDMFGRNKKYL